MARMVRGPPILIPKPRCVTRRDGHHHGHDRWPRGNPYPPLGRVTCTTIQPVSEAAKPLNWALAPRVPEDARSRAVEVPFFLFRRGFSDRAAVRNPHDLRHHRNPPRNCPHVPGPAVSFHRVRSTGLHPDLRFWRVASLRLPVQRPVYRNFAPISAGRPAWRRRCLHPIRHRARVSSSRRASGVRNCSSDGVRGPIVGLARGSWSPASWCAESRSHLPGPAAFWQPAGR
jgi:hypothetical protein